MKLRKAFTLIELLVVIAIISLLISILLPSLSQAREQAKTVKCGANLRSIGQGLISCQTENQEFGPSWDDGEAQTGGGSNKYLYTWGETIFDLRYMGNRDSLICPTDRLPDRRVEIAGAQPSWSTWKWVNTQGAGETPQPGWRGSYGINVMMHGNFREDRFQDPTRQVYIADAWWVWFENVGAYQVMYERLLNMPPPSPRQPTDGSTVAWRHGRQLGSEFLYVDGHVAPVIPKIPSNQL
ncbi:MAG: type II secretion system protein, partial [Phycisphaerae bacterium]